MENSRRAEEAAEIQQQKQEAAARILHETLNDLGYTVEPITHTLFADGGDLHFWRSGWDENYFVRLRIRPDQERVYFTPVRRSEKPEVLDPESRKQQDARMEQAWCDGNSGLPKLRQVLKDRGLDLGILREIPPGELPVQVVASEQLPVELRSVGKSTPSATQPLERKMT
jgi:hypothetical protein